MFKKAMELYENCDVEVTLVTNNQGVYHFYNTGNESMFDVFTKYMEVLKVSPKSFSSHVPSTDPTAHDTQDESDDQDEGDPSTATQGVVIGSEMVLEAVIVQEAVSASAGSVCGVVVLGVEGVADVIEGAADMVAQPVSAAVCQPSEATELLDAAAALAEIQRKAARRARKEKRRLSRLAAAERASRARNIAVKQSASDLENDALVMGIAFLDPRMIPQKCQKLGPHVAVPFSAVGKVPQEDASVGLPVKQESITVPEMTTNTVALVKKRKRVYDHTDATVVPPIPPVMDEDMGSWLAGVEVSLEGGRGADHKTTAHSDPIFALFTRH